MLASFISDSARGRKTRRVIAALLFLVAAVYMLYGAAMYARGEGIDTWMRWQETQYILHGQNPNDVFFAHRADEFEALESDLRPEDAPVIEELGPIEYGCYPPWCYGTLALYNWGSLPLAQVLFALMNAVALVWIGWWSWTAARRSGLDHSWALLALAAVCATYALSNTLRWGNLGVVCIALALGALRSAEHRRWLIGGLLLGASFVKPTVALPFGMLFLIRGRWGTLAVAGAYSAAAAGFTWFLTGTDPLTMLSETQQISLHVFQQKGVGLLQALIALEIPREIAYGLTLYGTVVVTTLALFAMRRRTLLSMFAVCAVGARLWTYHQEKDNLLLIPLVLALLFAFHRTGIRFILLAAALVAASIIAPGRIPGVPAVIGDPYELVVNSSGHVLWVLGACIVLIWGGRSPDEPDPGHAPSPEHTTDDPDEAS